MTPEGYNSVTTFEAGLEVGQRVIICWTNNHRRYGRAATIRKINARSVLAAIDTAILDSEGHEIYPAGHCIKAPKLVGGRGWSVHNRVYPLS